MSKYSLTLSNHISLSTKISVYELCENDESLFKDFFDKIESDGNLLSNLASAIRIVEDTANLNRRPVTQFRELKDKKINCKIYEAKSGSIRIYLFHEEKKGRIIVTGGVKNKQEKDIKRIKGIIKKYINENQ